MKKTVVVRKHYTTRHITGRVISAVSHKPLSGAIVGILWRIMYNYNNGVINEIFSAFGLSPVNWLETKGVTNFAIIVGNTWAQVGLCFVIFLAGLQSIPTDLYEAAVLDGASSGQILRKITFPMMAPSISCGDLQVERFGMRSL